MSKDKTPHKDESPSAPIEITPDLTDVPVDDKAEPKDAEVTHEATEEEVNEAAEEEQK